ncbi:MAG TPA: hypothetical protein VGQ83_20080 [Polyangia bacterium]|jgi:hypothetical protein
MRSSSWIRTVALLTTLGVVLAARPALAAPPPPHLALDLSLQGPVAEATKLYLTGLALKKVGITVTISGGIGLAAGVGLIVWGYQEPQSTAMKGGGWALVGTGVLLGVIGIPIWMAGNSRIARAKKTIGLPSFVMAPYVAPTAGGLVAGLAGVSF